MQQTEIGDASDNYAEIVNLAIRAENPFDWTETKGDQNVRLVELPHPEYSQPTERFYDGSNLSTLLDETGMVSIPSGSSSSDVTLVGGRAIIQLKAVADARVMLDGSRATLPSSAYYQGQYGALLQALPAFDLIETGDPVTPTASDVLTVDQWVDERSCARRRDDPGLSWTSTDLPNLVRDWLEKKAWDVFSIWPDDGTGEVDAACGVPSTLHEDPTVDLAGWVHLNSPSTISFNPTAAQLRHPAGPGLLWFSYYNGLYREDASDGFPAIALHESRHSWQFSLVSWGVATDQDGDLLFAASATIPPTSSDLLDGPNAAAQGVNGDGHFKGDGTGLQDAGRPPRVMRERNAQRFTKRLGATTTLSCALSNFSLISGDGQAGPPNQQLPQPLVVEVLQRGYDQAGNVADVAAPGVTVRFAVPQGSTATVNGAREEFAMTDDAGSASVRLTNGAMSTTIMVTLLPPMGQYQCPLNSSQLFVSLNVL